MAADRYLLATAGHLHHHSPLKMTASLLHDDSLDSHHNSNHHHHQDERASSVTSDQYSSLNLSSVGSSAHHSPIIEHDDEARCGAPEFSELSIAAAFDNKAAPGRRRAGEPPSASSLTSSSGLSDYHGSIPCSPVESVEDELLLLGQAAQASLTGGEHEHSPAAREDTQRQKPRQTRPTSTISNNNNNNNHLHPDQNHHHQKARSYSHSTAFSPLVVQPPSSAAAAKSSATPPAGKSSPADEAENRCRSQPSGQLAPSPAAIVERPRRLSRIENRQSLHDLGYGRIESYFKLQQLGKGTYATVYMGRSKLSNDLVALKEILKEHDEGAPCTAIREVSLLRLLRHNNIVTLHDICHTPKKLTLVFEYVGPDLYAYMKENNHLLSIHNVRLLLYQLLRGIAFCHSRQVLHRDLKPQNLLINSRGELKICDFGLARAKSIPTKSYSNEVVTLWYRPPDVLLGNTDYDHSIDMWGVGCIFYEMASGRTFFPGSSVRQQLYLIFSSLGAPSQANWPEILTNPDYLSYSFPAFRPEKLAHRVPRLEAGAVQLLQSFLRFKPSERISADEARRDAFFACLPERVHHLSERESIFDVPGVYMTLNPGQKLTHNNSHHHHHHHHQQHH